MDSRLIGLLGRHAGATNLEISNGLSSSIITKVLYMSSRFWLLGVESRVFSHAEKERIICKDEQIHKMTTIFTQNGPRLSF